MGGRDSPVIDLNKEAFDELQCERKMEIVEGTSHLFEKSGKLEQVAQLSASI